MHRQLQTVFDARLFKDVHQVDLNRPGGNAQRRRHVLIFGAAHDLLDDFAFPGRQTRGRAAMQEAGDLIGDGVFHPNRTLRGRANAVEQILDRQGSPKNAARAQLEGPERLDLRHFVNPKHGRGLGYPSLQFAQQPKGATQTASLIDEYHMGSTGGNGLHGLQWIGGASHQRQIGGRGEDAGQALQHHRLRLACKNPDGVRWFDE